MKKERLNKYVSCEEDYLTKVGSTKISKRRLLVWLLGARKKDVRKDIEPFHTYLCDSIASHIQDAEFDVP